MLIALKLKSAFAAATMIIGPLALAALPDHSASPAVAEPAVIALAAGTLAYRLAGDFERDGRPVGAPIEIRHFTAPLRIMREQVSAADYHRCVAAGACAPLASDVAVRADYPAVKVSWRDAQAYAAWLSAATGARWRLPTDAEWAYAAGSRFADDGDFTLAGNDPAARWLARYERESGTGSEGSDATRPSGSFGSNEHGLVDLAGNVWEWTRTCFTRYAVGPAGTRPTVVNCGVRVVEGAHRTYVTDFIRDARAGGCAVGKPPSNLGFRLVREDAAWSIARAVSGWIARRPG